MLTYIAIDVSRPGQDEFSNMVVILFLWKGLSCKCINIKKNNKSLGYILSQVLISNKYMPLSLIVANLTRDTQKNY